MLTIYSLFLVSTVLIRDSYNPDKYYDVNQYSLIEQRLTKEQCEERGIMYVNGLKDTKRDESTLYHICVKAPR